ncbi:MAG: bifunctional phosphopantothenoylcysteine decarboxylase/phosphopantothenate--cysteine ligase CoaBC [Bdellovibrionales bacterium]|nr:bifunctional phosphopantothenoylcysteine decarboxylase/phosphopantothenate--cysteine ligase CoaBC [Bdellovibrionales bacterium]
MPNGTPRILVCISGSIAAYKAADVVSALTKKGYEVKCLMTRSAREFVTPLVLETLSRKSVTTELWGRPGEETVSGTEHIRLARWPDVIAFIPATAHLIARLSHGLADDLVTTVALASEARFLVAPAMNAVMWAAAPTQENVARLKSRGIRFIEPAEGLLACGEEGSGKLAHVDTLVSAIEAELPAARAVKRTQPQTDLLESDVQPQSWKNQNVLITAGPTISRIDAVRYMTNPSTGTMGVRLAEEALKRGARVSLVLGQDKGGTMPDVSDDLRSRLNLIPVQTADEMLKASLEILPSATAVIASAAVLDYQVKKPSFRKQKRASKALKLELVPSVDVLAGLVGRSTRLKNSPWFMGFAAETDDLETNARGKLKKKKLNYVFGNWISATDQKRSTGFGKDRNAGVLFYEDGRKKEFPETSKQDLAGRILSELEKDLRDQGRFQ